MKRVITASAKRRSAICGLADISPESRRTAAGLAVGDCVYDEDLDTLFVVSNIEGGKDGTVVVTDEEGETYYYDPNDTLYWQANNR